MTNSGSRRSAAAVLSAAIVAFLMVLYSWSAAVVATEDKVPTGERCSMPRGYIVMDEQDIVTGAESVRWLPLPVTVCKAEGLTSERWSTYHLAGLPLALGTAVVVGWALARSKEPTEHVAPSA